MKIAISVLGNLSQNEGTTVRAKRIFDLINKHYDAIFILRGSSKFENTIVIKPDETKLWNLKIIPAIIKNKFDIVYCSADYFGFITYYFFSKIYGYKIIFETHGIQSVEYKEGHEITLINKIKLYFYQILEKFVITNSDYVIALSDDIYNFNKNFNKNVKIVTNYVNEDLFVPKIRKKRFNKIIGLIGPFKSNNINLYFLDFLYSNLNKFDDRINFVVMGKCDYKIKNDRVRYTGYLRDIEDYIHHLNSLDAVLVPSKLASFGALTKILEPMACSIPVFVTPVGTIGLDHAKNFENILIFEEKNMVNMVNELIFDENLMDKIGTNARKTIKRYYGQKINEKELIGILSGLKEDI